MKKPKRFGKTYGPLGKFPKLEIGQRLKPYRERAMSNLGRSHGRSFWMIRKISGKPEATYFSTCRPMLLPYTLIRPNLTFDKSFTHVIDRYSASGKWERSQPCRSLAEAKHISKWIRESFRREHEPKRSCEMKGAPRRSKKAR